MQNRLIGRLFRNRFFRIFLTLLVLSMIGYLATSEFSKFMLYRSGIDSIQSMDLEQAFEELQSLYKLDPEYRDVALQLAWTVDEILTLGMDNLDLQHNVDILRWLTSTQDWEALATALDQSMVLIPAGEFEMGSDQGDYDERPQRRIDLDAYEIDRYEVTNLQYQLFLLSTGRRSPQYWTGTDFPPSTHDFPVVGVSWEDAEAYCQWTNKRLPSEAEWEKACRGNQGNLYPWGDTWHPDKANVGLDIANLWPEGFEDAWELLSVSERDSELPSIMPVGSFISGVSPYGVLDMVGNVEEWTADWYNPSSYQNMPQKNPLTLEPKWAHSIRGSGWVYRHGVENWVSKWSRCSSRNASHSFSHARVGFRCARSYKVSGKELDQPFEQGAPHR